MTSQPLAAAKMATAEFDPADASVRCSVCGGNGWRLQRQHELGGGLYEITCGECFGRGWVAASKEDAS